jgi:cupin fold WbuC family metalloprotein
MKLITKELLDNLTAQAQSSPRGRMNYNLHESMEAPIHRLLNALEPDTYLPPHRHPDKEETYLVIRGSLLAFFFDNDGNVTERVKLCPAEGSYGLEIPANTWHSIISLETGTTIFELKSGPYRPLAAEDTATWAPAPTDREGIDDFRKRLLSYIL